MRIKIYKKRGKNKEIKQKNGAKHVMSGSLLGVELKGIASAPVGYLTILRMYPMDFEEFMIANQVSVATLDMLEEKWKASAPVDDFIHQKLLALFFVYLIVGGMPDAVKTYIETKDIRKVDQVQRDITMLYKEDFSRYELEDRKLKLKSIYDIIPAELDKQNKKFVFTMLDKELKFDRYENSFLWLKDAGVALPVYNVDAPVIPLLASKSSNVFRLFSSDIGLLTSAYPAETKMELINKNGEVNNGAHFENVIAQQFYELKEMLGDDCIEVKKGCIVSVSAIFSYSGFAFRFFEIANAIHSCYSSFKAYFLLSCLSGGNNPDSAFK